MRLKERRVDRAKTNCFVCSSDDFVRSIEKFFESDTDYYYEDNSCLRVKCFLCLSDNELQVI